MGSFFRDMAILALLIVAGIVWRLYSLVTRRGHRMREREVREVAAVQSAKQAPIPGMAEYAAAHGWQGPATDLGQAEQQASEFAKQMLGNISGNSRQALSGTNIQVSGPLWANVFTGQANGRPFVIGDLWMGFGGSDQPGSVCVLHLGQTLPPLFVNLRRYQAYFRLGMKEIPFESEDFNRRFRVLALDRKYTMDVIGERTMALLLERDDWVFALEFDRLVCLARGTLASPQDYERLLDDVGRFADLIPAFVDQDRGLHLPTLPDGTTFDMLDPASREKAEHALLAMSPEQRAAALTQVQTQGLRFVAGMFGKEVPAGLEEKLRERLEERMPHEGTGAAPPPGGDDPPS
jgi:hypothetical protein